MKKLYLLSALLLIAFVLIYSCSTEEEDTTPPPSVVATPEPEPPAPTQYTFTVTAGEGGTVSTEGGTYDEGTEVTVTATPDEGYEFVGWDGDNSSSSNLSITLNSDITLQALFQRLLFESKSETFSSVNMSTSYYNGHKNFVRYTHGLDNRDFLIEGYEENSSGQASSEYWSSFNNTTNLGDFNNDGFVDLYTFLIHFPPNEPTNYGGVEGKHLIIYDYFSNDKSNRLVIDSNISWNSGRSHVGDFDSDGLDDILIFSDNEKPNTYLESEFFGGNANNPHIKGEILFNLNGEGFERREIGKEINSHGGGSVGDIDNDGDLDIVVSSIRNNDYNLKPKLLINDGAGNFTVTDLFDSSLNSFYRMYYYTLSLFDLNDDGYLDLVAARDIGEGNEYQNQDCCYEYQFTDPIIFWGDETSKFSINRKTVLNSNSEGLLNKGIVLGFGFTDYDSDGDIDLLATTTLNEEGGNLNTEASYYNSYVIFLYENNGDKTFLDVSKQKINGQKETDRTKFIDFYDFATVDFDQDGDFDIFPRGAAILNRGSYYNNKYYYYNNNLYWENTGGQFVRRQND